MSFLSQDDISFIKSNIKENIDHLALRFHKKHNNLPFLLKQIESRNKARNKMPEWSENYNLLFPHPLNIEQSSSFQTASIKSSLVSNGDIGVDLTGGFGVDTYFLSKKFNRFYYIEPDKNLLDIVVYNFDQLGVNNVVFINSTAEEFIKSNNQMFDLIYVDPSRRNQGEKIILLSDSSPNILKLQSELISRSNTFMIKTSPILDFHKAISQLNNINTVINLSLNDELKEILYEVNKFNDNTKYLSINYKNTKIEKIEFSGNPNINNFQNPQKYLYEPSAGLMKFGFWGEIADHYKIEKISKNTHFFTSDFFVEDFHGKVFEFLNSITKKNIKKILSSQYCNVISRNHPLKTVEIVNQFKLKQSGNLYILAFRDKDNIPQMILANRIK